MTSKSQVGRRGFFKAAALGGAAAVAAVATTIVRDNKPTVAASEADPSVRVGYRATAHVQHYYRTTQV
jgi:hypothetical protein